MAHKVYEIEYVNGEKEVIDSKYVCSYYPDLGGDLSKRGTGTSFQDLLKYIKEGTPIVISKEIGRSNEDNIEKIINTHQIKAIRPTGLPKNPRLTQHIDA